MAHSTHCIRKFSTAAVLLMATLPLHTWANPDPELAAERADWSNAEFQAVAADIHQRHLTLDTHLDVPIVLRRPGFDISAEHSWEEHASQIDFPRMKKGGLDGGFFVVFVRQGPVTSVGRANAIEQGFSIAELIRTTVRERSDEAGLATTAAEAAQLREAGKHVVFMGIENGYAIGRNLDLLTDYHELGVRYFSITHTRNNDLGDSSTDPYGALHLGLSELGKAAVDECNRLGLMIDVSHASDKTTWDVLKRSRAPLLASHSGSYAIHPHPRNINDPLLAEIGRRGGVVQMNVFSSYLMDVPPDPERTAAFSNWMRKYRSGGELTPAQEAESLEARVAIEREHPKPLVSLATVVDQIDHMVEVMGMDHVGVSGDFDGGGGAEDFMDVGDMMNLTVEMLRRGYSEEDLGKFWGGNVMRVLTAVQAVAEEMKPAEPDSM